ncbi:MAG: cupin domain-containing protein [Rhodomicrobium sp.]
MTAAGNVFEGVHADACEHERTSEILALRGLKIERIVSTGQASPPGFWYDQGWDEWVMILKGAAGLRFEKEAGARALAAGDYVFIPAHARHRVDWTSADEPTVWLAVHRT